MQLFGFLHRPKTKDVHVIAQSEIVTTILELRANLEKYPKIDTIYVDEDTYVTPVDKAALWEQQKSGITGSAT